MTAPTDDLAAVVRDEAERRDMTCFRCNSAGLEDCIVPKSLLVRP